MSNISPSIITINGDQSKPISPLLFGVFFEDLNYAADGGLYAELIQNRSFEYHACEQPTWNSLTAWELVQRDGQGGWAVDQTLPLHPNNPNYIVLSITEAGDGVGLVNAGFGGIAVQAGESYEFSCFARQLYMNKAWAADSHIEGRPMPLVARLETQDGEVLAEAPLQVEGRPWQRITATLTASRTEAEARFVLLAQARGGIALDEISLFPQRTFCNRPNGLRADLAQWIADLKPRFVRFPGGCLVHGHGLGNFYRWKDTIGPIEQRKGQRNIWGYHQSVGLGYFEYFQFCEDIGAKPLPVVAAGVSCQNSGHTPGCGQQCLALEDMPAYIQELFDLIEWANGPVDSKWGAKRAAAGHPEPFGLEYLGVGNEDHITPGFKERFAMIYAAFREKHPEITVVGTTGPFHSGEDYDEGWKIANELRVPMVDEHFYEHLDWFWNNLERYDAYDRNASKVYVGEYAVHDEGRRTTLRSAIAEAAFLTSVERNGDIVAMTSYAPLLAKIGHTQWNPDLIYFNDTGAFPTLNYWVQQLFAHNAGETYLATEVTGGETGRFAVSTVRHEASGDIILKIVNGEAEARPLRLHLPGGVFSPTAQVTVLSGDDPLATNTFETAEPLLPQVSTLLVGETFDYEAPGNSVTVIRLSSPRKSSP